MICTQTMGKPFKTVTDNRNIVLWLIWFLWIQKLFLYIHRIKSATRNRFYYFVIINVQLKQAGQTQTSLRAAKATKTAEGAAKVPKNPSVGHI